MLVMESNVFKNVQDLNEVIINDISRLGPQTFNGCDNLTEIYCKPITPPTCSYNMLYGSQFASGNGYIYVPNESVVIYKSVSF
jgi:hypothetical protein